MKFVTAFNSTAGYLVVDELGHGIDASGWGAADIDAPATAALIAKRKLRVVQAPPAGVPVDPRAVRAFELTARLNAAVDALAFSSAATDGPSATLADVWAWRPPVNDATRTDNITEEA